MLCPHCQLGSYFGTCTCLINNDPCPLVRRCNVEHKWLPLSSMDRCRLRMHESKVKNMSSNKNIVRFESKGKLYVEYNGRVVKINNPYDYTPDGVEIVEVDGQIYIKGFEPKQPVKYDEVEEVKDSIGERFDSEEVVEEKPKKKSGSRKSKKKDK